ncbi:hypothetical protein CERSUDRAFT_117929 [Gelatoporia subvermispora B]|uniref:Peptidyl-prolyl cis-trans isomerase D n=1 Tax=Ceriporiopsis subvermispora (strain B) TaxID=914234 RepID=M2R315_CERS8|nr:hypothetical protein CERSUDRAFT_117929 [Gelatoporia subvermispora B]
MVRPRVFFDVAIDGEPAGRIIFELFNDTAPKTCENFRALCTGEKGLSPLSQRPLYYKDSIVHRSIKDFMIQGGDFTKRNGMGGESIYGGTFADEDLERPLDAAGLLCMANKGPNTNGSQFFVTLRACPHLNGKHVVFGRVIRGADVVEKIADVPVDEKDRPRVPVAIANCGELVLRAKAQPAEAQARAAKSGSESASDDERQHRNKKRHRSHHSRSPSRPRSRSRSRSPARDNSDDERERRRKHKKSKRKHRKDKEKENEKDRHRSRSPSRARSPEQREPEEETEEQYDARLEREEQERLEAERRRELERLKKLEEAAQTKNGVRFKGRGRMKYIDPELHRRD